jgi:hypothetical protein
MNETQETAANNKVRPFTHSDLDRMTSQCDLRGRP